MNIIKYINRRDSVQIKQAEFPHKGFWNKIIIIKVGEQKQHRVTNNDNNKKEIYNTIQNYRS